MFSSVRFQVESASVRINATHRRAKYRRSSSSTFSFLSATCRYLSRRSEVGRGTGAVASHGEGKVRCTFSFLARRVMIINPLGTAPFSSATPTVNVGALWVGRPCSTISSYRSLSSSPGSLHLADPPLFSSH